MINVTTQWRRQGSNARPLVLMLIVFHKQLFENSYRNTVRVSKCWSGTTNVRTDLDSNCLQRYWHAKKKVCIESWVNKGSLTEYACHVVVVVLFLLFCCFFPLTANAVNVSVAPITHCAHVRNKNSYTQGSWPNVVKVIFHTLKERIRSNSFLREVPFWKGT